MKAAYNRLSHVIRNNVPIILHHLKACKSCNGDVRDEVERRVLEIKEAFDGSNRSDNAISDDPAKSVDDSATEGL